jgi:hypothetical protein
VSHRIDEEFDSDKTISSDGVGSLNEFDDDYSALQADNRRRLG